MTAGCQWIGPEQDPQKGPVQYCGCTPLWPGRNYCEEHVWRVYKKGTAVGMSRKNKVIEDELAELKRQQEIDEVENYND
jgi:hypothetical protein